MRKLALLYWALFLLGLQGCVVLPASKKPIAGVEINATRLRFIEPGVTTRSQVTQELGPAYATFEDVRVLAYSWELRAGYVVWTYPLGVGTQMVGQPYVLLIELDEVDHVRRFGIMKRGARDTVRSRAIAWAQAGGNPAAFRLPSQFLPMSVPSGKSMVHIYRPGGFEVPFFAVRVALDTQEIADLRSKECVSVVTEPGFHSIALHPHPLSSGSGSLDVRPVDRTIAVNAQTNEATYIKVTVPAGLGRLDPHAKIVPEYEAMPNLRTLKPW